MELILGILGSVIVAAVGAFFWNRKSLEELKEMMEDKALTAKQAEELRDVKAELRELKEQITELRIDIEAGKRATHTVIPVGNTQDLGDFERKLRETIGLPEEDFRGDMLKAGAAVDPEELV